MAETVDEATEERIERALDRIADEESAEDEAQEAPEDKLGDAGKAALEAERKARKEAERKAREAEKRAKQLEDEKLSEEEKLKREAEEGRQLATEAQQKLRTANLLTELSNADHGLVDPRAALKLIDGVEYDDDTDEPINVKERVEALIEQYPFLKADGKRSDSTDPANPPANRKQAETQEDDAKLSGWMKSAFGIGGDDK